MFGSVVLNIVIGLAFIYCLYSLFTTTINEFIASILGLRAKMLERALWRMLTDDNVKCNALQEDLFNTFCNQPLIKYMNRGGHYKRIPSYISQESFSKALVDSLMECGKKSGQPISPQAIDDGLKNLAEKNQVCNVSDSDTLRLIKSYLIDSDNDLQKFRQYLEQWFNDMMERTTGWYKRQTQLITLIIGLFIAISFNVDTIKIVDTLSKDKSAQEQITQLATNYTRNHTGDVPDTTAMSRYLDNLVTYSASLYKDDISESHEILALGWNRPLWEKFIEQWYLSLLGWVITALAISLGAPFWFDLLNKLVQLRGVGTKPLEKTPGTQVTQEVSVFKRNG